jgi:hypothetical protein
MKKMIMKMKVIIIKIMIINEYVKMIIRMKIINNKLLQTQEV